MRSPLPRLTVPLLPTSSVCRNRLTLLPSSHGVSRSFAKAADVTALESSVLGRLDKLSDDVEGLWTATRSAVEASTGACCTALGVLR